LASALASALQPVSGWSLVGCHRKRERERERERERKERSRERVGSCCWAECATTVTAGGGGGRALWDPIGDTKWRGEGEKAKRERERRKEKERERGKKGEPKSRRSLRGVWGFSTVGSNGRLLVWCLADARERERESEIEREREGRERERGTAASKANMHESVEEIGFSQMEMERGSMKKGERG
jgi:hypothetical protein